MRKSAIYFLLISTLFLQGCIKYKDDPLCSQYKYLTFDELRQKVKVLPSQKIENAGKIYVYNDLLLVSEVNKGVHIINNQDKSNPKQIAFIKIYGNIDMAVKDGYLYLDSFMDLVVVNLNDLNDIQESKRVENVFPFDPFQSVSYPLYQCPFDTGKGVVVGRNE